MHGKTLTWALALALTFAATAGAQGVDRQERSARPDRAQQDSTFRRGRGGPEGMLRRGITLSADQQQKLAQLRENARKEFAANRPRRDGGNGPDAGPVHAVNAATRRPWLPVAPRCGSASTSASPPCAIS
jgi:hypothetical protein